MREDLRRVRLNFGKRVQQLRVSRGMSQEKLAEKSGVGVQHISDIERGRRSATLDAIAAISRGLGSEMVELFSAISARGPVAVAYVALTHDQLAALDAVVQQAKRTRTSRRKS